VPHNLPVLYGVYGVDQHEDIQQQAVSDPEDQRDLCNQEHEGAVSLEVPGECDSEPASDYVTEPVYDGNHGQYGAQHETVENVGEPVRVQ
jgi:hypothetical protein